MWIWKLIKRTGQNFEWPSLIGLWAFCTLAIMSLDRNYPLYFVITLAAVGIFLTILAAHNTYRQKSNALIDKYEEKFFERMKQERKLAAQYLLGKINESDGLEDILDFFEALIARRVITGEIDAFQIYSNFYHWIVLYLQAAKTFIEDYRKDEPAAWSSLQTLYDRMIEYEKAEIIRDVRKSNDELILDKKLALTPHKMQKYLEQEAR